MQSVGIDKLHGVASLLAEVESLRAQIERMSAELHKCRECASHFKWVIKGSASSYRDWVSRSRQVALVVHARVIRPLRARLCATPTVGR